MPITSGDLDQILKRPAMAKANQADHSPAVTLVECVARPSLESPHQNKEAGAGKCEVRIKSFRCRLQDPDNESCKYAIDQLRYSGVLTNDTQAEVLLVIEPQVRVHTEAEERTEMTLTWL